MEWNGVVDGQIAAKLSTAAPAQTKAAEAAGTPGLFVVDVHHVEMKRTLLSECADADTKKRPQESADGEASPETKRPSVQRMFSFSLLQHALCFIV